MMTNDATEKLERWLNRFRLAIRAKAEAEADHSMLCEQKKVILASLMQAAEESGHASIAAQEREARAAEEYRDFLITVREAEVAAKLAAGEVEALRLQFDGMRTIRASERVEARAYAT